MSILHRYAITKETYRLRFRKARKEANESLRELRIRLSDLVNKWTAQADRAGVLDLLVLEQLINAMPDDVQLHVKERQPASSEEAATIGDAFIEARSNHNASWPRRKCEHCGRTNHTTAACWSELASHPARTSPESDRDAAARAPGAAAHSLEWLRARRVWSCGRPRRSPQPVPASTTTPS